MKKTNNKEYEQLTIDFGDDLPTTPETIETKAKEFEVGAPVIVNHDAKRFCDGRGIPDYARKAYIKRINPESKTILIESEPNGREYGLLFMTNVTLA